MAERRLQFGRQAIIDVELPLMTARRLQFGRQAIIDVE